jgi:uncharacterized membrane protein YbaN (DUF454 family)
MKIVLLLFGFISLGLGVIGIFLPVLPTTPFVLLSAYLFGKSSSRFHKYLLDHKLFGPIIYDYHQRKALNRKTKIIAIISMWAVLLTSVIFFMPIIWVKVIVLMIGTATTIYLLRFPGY